MLILWISAVWRYYGHFEYDAKEAKYKDDEEVEIKSKPIF
jgi:hypothetical protein